MSRAGFFVIGLAAFFLVEKAFAFGTQFVVTWDPVTMTTTGETIPAGDIEYRLWGSKGGEEFSVFLITQETEWAGPSMEVGCYNLYATARRIASGLESVPSNTVTACIEPDEVGGSGDDPYEPGPVPPDVTTHGPPTAPPGFNVRKNRVNW